MKDCSIYNLKLHESTVVNDGIVFTTAIRVPGGWIYISIDKSHQIMSQSFVPYRMEFYEGDNETGKGE